MSVQIQAPPEKLRRLRELQARKAELDRQQEVRAIRRWDTPGELALALDPATVQTPALDLIDDALVLGVQHAGARLIISIAAAGRQSRAGHQDGVAVGADPQPGDADRHRVLCPVAG